MFDVIHAAIFVRWNDGCDEEELSHRPEAVAEELFLQAWRNYTSYY